MLASLPRPRPETLLAFVAVCLLALLLIPFWTQRSVRSLYHEVDEAADPARNAVTRIQYLLARQNSSLRGYLITGDSTFLRQYADFTAEERERHQELAPLVQRLEPEVRQAFEALRVLSGEWHHQVEQEIAEGRARELAGGDGELPYEQELYHQTLERAAELDEALAVATRSRRDAIERAELRGARLSAFLALLTIVAGLVMTNLVIRIRRLGRQAELRRQEAVAAAEERSRAQEARARLLRGIGHDVKNPLGVADGYAELLEMGLRGPLAPEQMAYVEKIRRAIHSALEVIHDLVELSRAETHFLVAQRELVDCPRLVAEIVEDYGASAGRTGLKLSSSSQPCPPLYTDPEHVRRIVGNLLSNAIKYTPAPGVVEVRTYPAGGESAGMPAWVVVEVGDSGPGIPPEQAEAIFGEFVRLHSDEQPGHGLGLAISRRYARTLGGDLSVGRARAGGAAFTLRLPVRSTDAPRTAERASPAGVGQGSIV